MYGSSLSMVTLRPRDSKSEAKEADVTPLPSDETTPPVTKIKRVAEAAIENPFKLQRFTMIRDCALRCNGQHRQKCCCM